MVAILERRQELEEEKRAAGEERQSQSCSWRDGERRNGRREQGCRAWWSSTFGAGHKADSVRQGIVGGK